jgi:hypothetical protein
MTKPPEIPPEITDLMIVQLYFGWVWEGCGFGECFLAYNPETKKWETDTETMGKESVRKFLHALADHIADQL